MASRVQDIEDNLNRQLVKFIHMLREEDLKKIPSISETIDWARIILLMHVDSLDTELVRDTMNVLLKFERDIESIERKIPSIVRKVLE